MIINDNVLRMKEVMEDAGNIIYTKLNHVTKSGMTRYISVICIIAVHCIFGFSVLGVLNIN